MNQAYPRRVAPSRMAAIVLTLIVGTSGFHPQSALFAGRNKGGIRSMFYDVQQEYNNGGFGGSCCSRVGHSSHVGHRLMMQEPKTRVDEGTSNTSKLSMSDSREAETSSTELKGVYQKAIITTVAWVGAASAFGIGLFFLMGQEAAEEFFAGYLIEQSLSVDNIFVFLLLFEYFKVPFGLQNKVLNWGIFGAFGMRLIVILAGAAALKNFREILLLFAGVLVYSSGKILLMVDEDEEEDPGDNAIVKFANNLVPSTNQFDGENFFTLEDGIRKATPLFICLIAVEISDVVFAVDSIPAVFGVTEDPLIVFTSNMFAIMGLRSLFTVLSKAASDLAYLEPSVAVVLGFIGSKLIAEYFGYVISTEYSLFIVASLLGAGVAASLYEKGELEEDR